MSLFAIQFQFSDRFKMSLHTFLLQKAYILAYLFIMDRRWHFPLVIYGNYHHPRCCSVCSIEGIPFDHGAIVHASRNYAVISHNKDDGDLISTLAMLLKLNQCILLIFLFQKLHHHLFYSAVLLPPEESYISPCPSSSLDFPSAF